MSASKHQISIRKSAVTDAQSFVDMENIEGTANFILPYSLERHRKEIAGSAVDYYSIFEDEQLAGFLIIATTNSGSDIELRRIVIASQGRGIGQAAISTLERLCRQTCHSKRIWLDVFEDNHRGRYIYEKLGFRFFKETYLDDRKLLFYEKLL